MPNPETTGGSSEAEQRHVVERHFREASTAWGDRYSRSPRRMSDLDLQLRRDNVHRLVRPLLRENGARRLVVDVGCGSGDVLVGLPRSAMSVVGLDSVPEMVRAAAKRHPEDRFAVADASRLALRHGGVDIATCLGVLEYLPRPEEMLESLARVLKPDGVLIVSVPNRASALRPLSRLEARLETVLAAAVRGRRRGDRAAAYRHRQWTPREATELLESAGFAVERMVFNTYGLWGRIGRWRPSLALSASLSRVFYRRSPISTYLASTIVIQARRGSRSQGSARSAGGSALDG